MEFTALAIHLRVVTRLELAITDAACLLGQAAAHAAMLLRRQLMPQAATAAVTAQIQSSVHFRHGFCGEMGEVPKIQLSLKNLIKPEKNILYSRFPCWNQTDYFLGS